MVNAFVLINIQDKDVHGLAEKLLAIPGVTEVYPIAGEYDFLCIIRVKDNETLSEVLTRHIIHQEGVRHTKTLFALGCFSKVDIKKVFAVE